MNNTTYALQSVCLMMLHVGLVLAGPPRPDDKELQERWALFRQNATARTSVSFRAGASDSSSYLRCVLRNNGASTVAVDDLYHSDNTFRLESPGMEVVMGYSEHSPKYNVLEPGKARTWIVDVGDLIRRAGLGTCMPGTITNVRWFCVVHPLSAGIWIAVPENGRFTPPTPTDPTVKPLLAIVHQEKRPPEFGFLILNGSKKSFAAPAPLSERNTIHASAPAIAYARELTLPKAEPTTTVVEPGKVGQWRLPWQTVLDLIPKEDRAKIEASGGDLDLVWKVGDLESPVLPISLTTKPGEHLKE